MTARFPFWSSSSNPGCGDAQQVDTRTDKPVKQVDHVVVLDEGVCQHDEQFGQRLLARDDSRRGCDEFRICHCSSAENHSRRCTTSVATSASDRPLAKARARSMRYALAMVVPTCT